VCVCVYIYIYIYIYIYKNSWTVFMTLTYFTYILTAHCSVAIHTDIPSRSFAWKLFRWRQMGRKNFMATCLVCFHDHTMNKIYFQLSVCMNFVCSVLFHRSENTRTLKRNRLCKCNCGTTNNNFPRKELIFSAKSFIGRRTK